MAAVTPTYFDQAGLARLKVEAGDQSDDATREAARQFEALFVQMMLKSMRDASAILGEKTDRTYQEMFDKELSIEMTRGEGLGIATMLMRQLGVSTDNGAAAQTLPAVTPMVGGKIPARQDFRPADQETFLEEIWPHAKSAAAELDVDPAALMAQAALETGWGQKLVRDQRGTGSNNLFNIKADRRWDGERVNARTVEYEHGVANVQSAAFRAYENIKESFDDYVHFLKSNPRYEKAVAGDLSATEFAGSLQEAGYATDPDYAQKIGRILESPVVRSFFDRLKPDAELPKSF